MKNKALFGALNLDGLAFNVKLTAKRQMFGRMDVMVTPVAGSGERIVQLAKISGISKADAEKLPDIKTV